MGHGLAQFLLFVGVFDQVGLVDDIDQVARFGDPPEHTVHTQAQLPFVVADLAVHQNIGFAQVEVRALGVGAVIAKERCQVEASAPVVLKVKFRLREKAGRMRALSGKQAGLRVPSGFANDASREIVVDDLCPSRYAGQAHNGHRPNGGQDGAAYSGTEMHQRIRLNPVRVKSFSSRSVWNWNSVHSRTVLLPVR